MVAQPVPAPVHQPYIPRAPCLPSSALKPTLPCRVVHPHTTRAPPRNAADHGHFARLCRILLRHRAGRGAPPGRAERVRALLQTAGPRQRHLHVQRGHALLQPGVPLRADAARRRPRRQAQAGGQVRCPAAAVVLSCMEVSPVPCPSLRDELTTPERRAWLWCSFRSTMNRSPDFNSCRF